MLILDCSSRTQALHTLSAGFGCSPEKLKKVLLSLDLESIYELNPRQLDTIVSIKNDGHYFCRAGGNRPDGLNEPVTIQKI